MDDDFCSTVDIEPVVSENSNKMRSTLPYSIDQALIYLEKNTNRKYTVQDLSHYVMRGNLRPCFSYSGELIGVSGDSQLDEYEEWAYRNINVFIGDLKFRGYVTPLDNSIACLLLNLSGDASIYVNEVQLADPNPIEKFEFVKDFMGFENQDYRIKTASFYKATTPCNYHYDPDKGIELKQADCVFLEVDLIRIATSIQDKNTETFKKNKLELTESEKESLVIIATLVDFIIKESITKLKIKRYEVDVIRTQGKLSKVLDDMYSKSVTNMSDSTLDKTFADANAFVKKEEYPDTKNEGANRIIIASLLDFILNKVTMSTKKYQPFTIENQDHLIEQLVSRYTRKYISKSSLKEKFKDIESDNSLKNNK